MPSSAKVGLDCCRHQRRGQPAAPPLWRSEWRNVLSTYLWRDLLQISEAVASEQVLQLANRSRCSAYDCEFVVAAQQLGVPLVTEDRAVLVASRMWRDPWSRGWNGHGHRAETIQ
ncbi:MAG: type II toxin-antitoxin system VapC family toxin [Cyanobium sp. MAG_255]|nr:type II toxin-antitoxin system VapC family toxin [Cyanobium sp. MAG_255]